MPRSDRRALRSRRRTMSRDPTVNVSVIAEQHSHGQADRSELEIGAAAPLDDSILESPLDQSLQPVEWYRAILRRLFTTEVTSQDKAELSRDVLDASLTQELNNRRQHTRPRGFVEHLSYELVRDSVRLLFGRAAILAAASVQAGDSGGIVGLPEVSPAKAPGRKRTGGPQTPCRS